MEQIQSEPFLREVIKGIEETGGELKQSLKELSESAQKKIDSKINSSKFEAIYGLTISKKQREKTMKEVKETRLELWKDSLNKAKGDTKKAYVFYKDSCAFD